jgi:hypothetical protein
MTAVLRLESAALSPIIDMPGVALPPENGQLRFLASSDR